jgi:hypothetical protein
MAAPAIQAGKGEIMRRLVTATLAAAVLVLPASITLAQDKKAADKGAPKATMKVVSENAKVRAYEVTFAPGAENTSVPASSTRVVRALAGGTLERTYSDGKKEKVTYKTDEVRINEVSPAFTTKNIGKSEIKLYVVQVK